MNPRGGALQLVSSNSGKIAAPEVMSTGTVAEIVSTMSYGAFTVARQYDWLRRYRPHVARQILALIETEFADRPRPRPKQPGGAR